MLRWFLRRMIAGFERKFDYDAGYTRDVIDHAPTALLWLFLASRIVRRPKELPNELWFAAMLAGGMEADCGPCTQLVVRFAQVQGVPDPLIRAVVSGDQDAMRDDVRTVTRYVRSSLRHEVEADGFREEILHKWGRNALVRLAYLTTVSGLFPTMKYALGHGHACTRVRVGARDVVVNRLVPQGAL